MAWMGQLQSHHSYRKRQVTSSAALDATQRQRLPSDSHAVASPASLFTGEFQSTASCHSGKICCRGNCLINLVEKGTN